MLYWACVPKFKVESTLQLNEPMVKLGVKDMLDDKNSDLSGINGERDLYVSMVVQKAFVEVNEEGAEAAAATAAVVFCCSGGTNLTKRFVCDRPFYYMIRERESGLVLFSGRIVNPTGS